MQRPPESLQANVIYRIGEFTHAFHSAMTLALRKQRIWVTVEQFGILALLFYSDGANQQEVSRQLNRDKTTVARVISNMERKGLVRRKPDPGDLRGKIIQLTARGKAVQERAVEVSGELFRAATKRVTRHESRVLLRVIAKMERGIGKV